MQIEDLKAAKGRLFNLRHPLIAENLRF